MSFFCALTNAFVSLFKVKRYYVSIRSDRENRGFIIGAMDMLIAAHALSLGVTLVTNNIREFSRIPTLLLENWVE